MRFDRKLGTNTVSAQTDWPDSHVAKRSNQPLSGLGSMTAKSAQCEFAHRRILQLRRKSGLTGRTAALPRVGERQQWAVRNKTLIYRP
ncbi:hypothetical protein [Pseudopelagicola sp. nBUS_19]|uniref:hypothetical protein n=1 Tax=Pseudopelagicola sp. nBUS_19 TaxID=3395316 RepID=UPI003EBE370F